MSRVGKYDYLEEDILKLYKEEELSIRAIAKKLDLSKEVVTRIVKKNVEIRPKTNFTEEKKQDAIKLYNEDYSFREISSKLGCNLGTVRRYLGNTFNIPIEGRLSKYAESMKKDYKNGLSVTEIANKYKASRQSVHNYLCCESVELRENELAVRKYDMDFYYFENLTNEKAYDLGYLISISRFYINESSGKHIVRFILKEEEKDTLINIINKFSDKNSDSLEKLKGFSKKSLRFDINSKTFYYKLKDITDGQREIDTEYQKEFFRGFFESSARFTSRYFNYTSKSLSVDIINKYLVKVIGLDKESLIISKRTSNNIMISKKSEIIKLVTKLSYLLDKLYKTNDTGCWNKVIDKINKDAI